MKIVLVIENFSNIYDWFEILKVCNSYNKLLAVEALLIKKFQPNLNNKFGPYEGFTDLGVKCYNP